MYSVLGNIFKLTEMFPSFLSKFCIISELLVSLTLCVLLICSKDPGFIRMNVHDPQTMKDDVSMAYRLVQSVIVSYLGLLASQALTFSQVQQLSFACMLSFPVIEFIDFLQEPLLKIGINDPALIAGNWSQLCATCKVLFFNHVHLYQR